MPRPANAWKLLARHPAIVVFTTSGYGRRQALAQHCSTSARRVREHRRTVESMYHWRGRIETSGDPVADQDATALYTEVEAAIRNIHPMTRRKSLRSRWSPAIALSALDAAEARSG
jgi:hypothetical protein